MIQLLICSVQLFSLLRVEKKLANQGFVAKAPQKLVEEEKAKGEKYREMLATVIARLDSLK